MRQGGDEAPDDYLKQIYELSRQDSPVKTSHLALKMGVSPASVTEMVKRLAQQELVEHRLYHGVVLTDRGRERALAVLRRHRLWGTFLHQVLGVRWMDLREHACRLEHATDEKLTNLIDDYLGHPRYDPHGDPIPEADGSVRDVWRFRLSSLSAGDRSTIIQCVHDDLEFAAYLEELGLIPGATVKIAKLTPFNGPLTVETGTGIHMIGFEVARTLLVQPL